MLRAEAARRESQANRRGTMGFVKVAPVVARKGSATESESDSWTDSSAGSDAVADPMIGKKVKVKPPSQGKLAMQNLGKKLRNDLNKPLARAPWVRKRRKDEYLDDKSVTPTLAFGRLMFESGRLVDRPPPPCIGGPDGITEEPYLTDTGYEAPGCGRVARGTHPRHYMCGERSLADSSMPEPGVPGVIGRFDPGPAAEGPLGWGCLGCCGTPGGVVEQGSGSDPSIFRVYSEDSSVGPRVFGKSRIVKY